MNEQNEFRSFLTDKEKSFVNLGIRRFQRRRVITISLITVTIILLSSALVVNLQTNSILSDTVETLESTKDSLNENIEDLKAKKEELEISRENTRDALKLEQEARKMAVLNEQIAKKNESIANRRLAIVQANSLISKSQFHLANNDGRNLEAFHLALFGESMLQKVDTFSLEAKEILSKGINEFAIYSTIDGADSELLLGLSPDSKYCFLADLESEELLVRDVSSSKLLSTAELPVGISKSFYSNGKYFAPPTFKTNEDGSFLFVNFPSELGRYKSFLTPEGYLYRFNPREINSLNIIRKGVQNIFFAAENEMIVCEKSEMVKINYSDNIFYQWVLSIDSILGGSFSSDYHFLGFYSLDTFQIIDSYTGEIKFRECYHIFRQGAQGIFQEGNDAFLTNLSFGNRANYSFSLKSDSVGDIYRKGLGWDKPRFITWNRIDLSEVSGKFEVSKLANLKIDKKIQNNLKWGFPIEKTNKQKILKSIWDPECYLFSILDDEKCICTIPTTWPKKNLIWDFSDSRNTNFSSQRREINSLYLSDGKEILKFPQNIMSGGLAKFVIQNNFGIDSLFIRFSPNESFYQILSSANGEHYAIRSNLRWVLFDRDDNANSLSINLPVDFDGAFINEDKFIVYQNDRRNWGNLNSSQVLINIYDTKSKLCTFNSHVEMYPFGVDKQMPIRKFPTIIKNSSGRYLVFWDLITNEKSDKQQIPEKMVITRVQLEKGGEEVIFGFNNPVTKENFQGIYFASSQNRFFLESKLKKVTDLLFYSVEEDSLKFLRIRNRELKKEKSIPLKGFPIFGIKPTENPKYFHIILNGIPEGNKIQSWVLNSSNLEIIRIPYLSSHWEPFLISFHPKKPIVAVQNKSDGNVEIYDFEKNRVIFRINLIGNMIRDNLYSQTPIKFSNEGKYLEVLSVEKGNEMPRKSYYLWESQLLIEEACKRIPFYSSSLQTFKNQEILMEGLHKEFTCPCKHID